MASKYDRIHSAEELLKDVAMHGLSTAQEDICRAQDIFGHSEVKELVRLANDNGRLKGFGGEPDPRGTVNSGRDGLSKYFYQVAFHIWNWEDAVRFYNRHSNFPVIDAMDELQEIRKKNTELNAALMAANDATVQEHKMRLDETAEKLDAQKEIERLKAELHDRDMAIMELKAKLYDLMVKEEQ